MSWMDEEDLGLMYIYKTGVKVGLGWFRIFRCRSS